VRKLGKQPEVPGHTTIRIELPEAVVEVLQKNKLKIKLDKIVANRLVDQKPGLVSSDGCWSTPSGPSC
jgi:hypothetical protein